MSSGQRRAVASLEVSGGAGEISVPQPVALQPPPPPPRWSVFKVMLKKHALVARKRKRVLTAVWPALLYCGCIVGMYYGLSSISETSLKATLFAIIVPLYMVLAVSGVLQCAIVEIVSEKESKMKIIQEIYGLTTIMYWVSWAGYFLIVSLVCIVVIYCLLTLAAPVASEANPILFLVILLAAYVQQLEFTAIAAIFFDKQQTASSVASILNLLVTMLAAGQQRWLRGQSAIFWYFTGLLPTVNVFNGIAAMMWLNSLYYCNADQCFPQGLNFKNLWANTLCSVEYSRRKPCPDAAKTELFSAGESIVLMVFDIFLYMFLAWWLDNVWQGEFGTAKPLTFCLNPQYMCPRRRPVPTDIEAPGDHSGQPVAMSIHRLRKVFGNKVAVDDMTLDVHGGEVFALLGHNGAGKTTAINCVVGLYPPTSGGAIVNGFDIKTDVEGARRQLSICPQDNPMYDVFTVRQHLTFFASLRGVGEQRVNERIGEVLSALGMPEKVDDLCTSLSGGQKRRLWVATALLGETPVVFLDEPTSGMDPSSRRELWSLLLQMRSSGRAIMFTTHYLEEADVLADRKAVLARGKVQAVGTSRDLKMQFGVGYHLLVELRQGATAAQVAEVKAIVQRHIVSARDEDIPEEERAQAAHGPRLAKFALPYHEVKCFGPLLLELDASKLSLQVSDYSIAMTSLEEVFMALGQQAEVEAGTAGQNADFREIAREREDVAGRIEDSDRRSAEAVARLRLTQLLRNRRSVYSTIILPALLVFIAMGLRLNQGQDTFTSAIYMPMAFGVSTITYTLHLVMDKQTKCKYAAIAQGLSLKSYWLGTATAHYLTSVPVVWLLVGIIVVRQTPGLYGNGLPLLVMEVFLYPLGLQLYAYNWSLCFVTYEMAVKVLPLLNLFLATIPTVLVSTFILLPSPFPEVAKAIHAVMSVTCPVYSLPGMVVFLMAERGQDVGYYFQSWAALPLYCSVISFLLFGGNLLWQDRRGSSARPGDFQAFGNERKDEDVIAEERRVAQTPGPVPEEVVRYLNLSHTYRTKVHRTWKETHAVRGISLGIKAGECFGLLGPNGAGKTTTLSVLTGEVRPPTAGRLFVCGQDIVSPVGLAAAYKLLGLCPQVDPLWESVTGRAHLMFYGRIKGVPEASLESTVDALLFRLGLDGADTKVTGQYSGGMKRKLSLGIALIGYSSLLFLDEPSAAVDAGAKRHLWKVIKMRSRGQTVVLTTHSMEEAEALCDRIAIQVMGQLRCLGSPLHIKHRYGSGYQLELFWKPASGRFTAVAGPADPIVDFVRSKLTPEAQLLEQHAGRYLFQLPLMGGFLTLGRIFSEVQSNMEAVGITDYSLTQPSLEQVFIRFAREQEREREEADDGTIPTAERSNAATGTEPLLAA